MVEGKNKGKEHLTAPFTSSHHNEGHPTLTGIYVVVQKRKICGMKTNIHSFQFTPKFTYWLVINAVLYFHAVFVIA
jgi:hypothetical protein